MKINSIQLNNFKCFEDRDFTFGSKVEISGKNGSGKTTIREAILFVLYNRTETAIKETDKYIKNGDDFCEVTLVTDQGLIKRQRSRSQSKLWLNNKETTQENLVEKLKLPEFVVFNSIFTAGYFMSLDKKAQRQLILDLTEPTDRTELFYKNGGQDKDLKKYNISLNDLTNAYKNVNTEKQKARKEQEKLEIIIKETIKHKDELGESMSCPFCFVNLDKEHISKVKERLDKEIKDYKKRISKLEEKQVDVKRILEMIKKIPIDEMSSKLKSIKEKLKKILPDADIKLMELLKSKIGYKPVFKLLINGKEYRFLSSSEKKFTDIGICKFLNQFYNLDIIFVDNMEMFSFTPDIDMPQIFIASVSQDNLVVKIK